MPLKYAKPERIWLKTHPELDERWLQDRIGEDPSLLGLGDLVLKDRERAQPRAGRLDLLLLDVDSNHRYEVEVQLGKTDEAHLVRTIEYWDLERKRFPQYDHTAVIVAEDITSRFLNVIALFNGFIPLVAIQLSAVRLEDSVSLVFTKVMDEIQLGLVEEDEELAEVADRAYWERRGTRQTLAMADELLGWLRQIDPGLELKYNKFYIGLAKEGHPNNFVKLRPRKDWIVAELRLDPSDETQARLEDAGVELLEYSSRYGRYRIRLTKADLANSKELLVELMRRAHGGDQ